MLPHLGTGAGMGIEDAYVLSQLLSHPKTNISNVEVSIYFILSYTIPSIFFFQSVLKAYDSIRVPRNSAIALASKRAGDIYEGHGLSGPSDEGLRRDLDMQWAKVWYHDTQDEVREAERMLFGAGAFKEVA
jgi:salicylate hydroxylase